MSSMIKCDSCNCLMFSDSRSEKGAYHEIWVDRCQQYHLCRICYDSMMRNIFHMIYNEDEQQYTEIRGTSACGPDYCEIGGGDDE